MKPARRILSIVAAAGIILTTTASPLWADSAAPTGNAADFLTGINCPDPDTSTTACFDPNASGTRFAGKLTGVYDKQPPGPEGLIGCNGEPFINNMYVSLTLQTSQSSWIFTTDYRTGIRPHGGFCGPVTDNQVELVKTIIDLIRVKVIPFIYLCAQPACPSFKVRSITNFVSTPGSLSSGTSEGFSADVTIAVR